MPQDDNATRRTARERSQERVSRYDGSYSRSSADYGEYTDSYGRAYQDSEHLSQSRYERQSPRQTSQSSRDQESGTSRRRTSGSNRRSSSDNRKRKSSSSSSRSSNRRSERSSDRRSSDRRSSDRRSSERRSERSSDRSRSRGGSRSAQSSRTDRRQSSRKDQRQQSRGGSRQSSRKSQNQPSRQQSSSGSILNRLPIIAVPVGIAVIVIIVLFVAISGIVSPGKSDTATPAIQVTSASSEAAAPTGIVHTVVQAKTEKQAEIEGASQNGSLDTSNNKIEALVSLLGEDETGKLIAQAKTNPDALWIAAHPDKYAFDGIEIQYKILKLAADEPASIDYVREFPAKYPASDATYDKDLAMSVSSPSDSVPNTSIPHLYQWDRRWAYTIYSSATFGLTGCGPTSLAMIYQGLNRTVDRTPHDMAVLAEERGFMSEYNGTDGTFFTSIAGELGLVCWEAYPDATNIRDELSQGHPIIANLGPGYFTTNGHFFVLAGLTDDGKVIVNDPYSVVRSSQTWDAEFIASETMAMYVYAKA